MKHNSSEHDRSILMHLADPKNSAGEIFSNSDSDLNSQQPQIDLSKCLQDAECYNTECREDDIAKNITGGAGGNAEETCHGSSKSGSNGKHGY